MVEINTDFNGCHRHRYALIDIPPNSMNRSNALTHTISCDEEGSGFNAECIFSMFFFFLFCPVICVSRTSHLKSENFPTWIFDTVVPFSERFIDFQRNVHVKRELADTFLIIYFYILARLERIVLSEKYTGRNPRVPLFFKTFQLLNYINLSRAIFQRFNHKISVLYIIYIIIYRPRPKV